MNLNDYTIGSKMESAQTDGSVVKRVTLVPKDPKVPRTQQFALPVDDATFAKLEAGQDYTLELTPKTKPAK